MGSSLAPVTHIDIALLRFGADSERAPSDYTGEWVDHLLWGADSAVAAARMMFCGQFVGAATIARNQLERWLLHRAYNAGLTQSPGEKTIDFIARVWSVDDPLGAISDPSDDEMGDLLEVPTGSGDPEVDHRHVQLSDGSEVCPAVLYGLLSELMHGRMLLGALEWENDQLLYGGDISPDFGPAIGAISDTLSLCLRQVRLAAMDIAAEVGDAASFGLLASSLDKYSDPPSGVGSEGDGGGSPLPRRVSNVGTNVQSPPMHVLAPLTPAEGLRPEGLQVARQLSGAFIGVSEGKRPAGRLYRDDELTVCAFGWHRLRSAETALRSLEWEREKLGDDFDEDSIGPRTVRWSVVAELAGLASTWLDDSVQKSALAVMGSGLRSAYWLWLEDDDRAMAVLRTLLEQAARARVARLKPDRAEKLESRVETMPRDWLEAAGWKRLAPLNKALGEFAHTKIGSKWSSARELLAEFQIDADPEAAIYTARGSALEFVSNLVASELADVLEGISPVIGSVAREAMQSLGYVDRLTDKKVDEQFNLIWSMRTRQLADPDFERPSAAV